MIRVLIVGEIDRQLFADLKPQIDRQQILIECRFVENEVGIENLLVSWRPQVILSFFPNGTDSVLARQTWNVRRRWVNYPISFTAREHAIGAILSMYSQVVSNSVIRPQKLVSIVTPTFNIGSLVLRAYESLVGQTYREWEWVVYDDSSDHQTVRVVDSIARSDPRVRVFRGVRHSGVIGEVKRLLFTAAEGEVVVELDHDDELTEQCLENLVAGLEANPDCGFVYTDFAEVNADGSPFRYGKDFAFGFGSYRPTLTEYHGKAYLVANSAPINVKTLSHIVGVPNHVRAWVKASYLNAGGHNPELSVGDDYELLLRTFLTTRFLHVRHFGYIQHRRAGNSNTHIVRNREIQSQIAVVGAAYRDAVQGRARAILGDAFAENLNQQLNLVYELQNSTQ